MKLKCSIFSSYSFLLSVQNQFSLQIVYIVKVNKLIFICKDTDITNWMYEVNVISSFYVMSFVEWKRWKRNRLLIMVDTNVKYYKNIAKYIFMGFSVNE